MKLIALKDFAYVGELRESVDIANRKHDNHVHKGAEFEIGKATKFAELGKKDQQLIGQLFVSGCIGDATDPKVVAQVKAELEIDKKREAAAVKVDTSAQNAALVDNLSKLVERAAK